MPILVPGSGGGESGPVVGTVAAAPLPPTITLVGNGDLLPLNEASGARVLDGLEGFDMPPYAVASSTPGGWDGGLFESVRAAERDVFVPIHLWADTAAEFRSLKRRLAALVDPKRGDVEVRVGQLDGAVRSAYGRYVGGIDTDLAGSAGLVWQNVGVTVRCFDPAWLGPATVAAEFAVGTADEFLGDPFFPLTIVSSQAIGDVEIDNPGDETAYPVVTVTGPGSDLTVECEGVSWTIPGAIGAGEVLTVDARRGAQTVEDQFGVSQWSRMGAGSRLWVLAPGSNDVSASLTGATSATRVRVEFRPRYLTAA